MSRLGNITHIYNITTKNLVNECLNEMFNTTSSENTINANENVIDINDDIVQKLMIDNKTLEELNGIVYCLMPSEQRGHLNGTIKFLKQHFNDLIYKHFNDIVEYSYAVNLLKKFNIAIEELKTKTYYYTELKNIHAEHYRFINKYYFFAYFCKEYSKLNIKNINKEKVLNYQNISFKEKQDVIRDMMNKIDENFENYKNKLYDTVYVHIYEPLTKYWKDHNIHLHTDQI